MRLFSNPDGFPMIEVPNLGLEVSLLPVTKVQLERFLSVPDGYGNDWYDALLSLNPRVSWRQFGSTQREGLFATGVFPTEALAFARFLGPGFDLPRVDEWRAIFRYLQSIPFRGPVSVPLHRAGRRILEQLTDQIRPKTLAEVGLFQDGVLEWVYDSSDDGYGGLGRPRPEVLSIAIDPLHGTPVHPQDPRQRSRLFGFRLVRRPKSAHIGGSSDGPDSR